jgi:CIC family chloride channel protein
MVGMGAFLAAAAQAPLMAVLMIFEMTLSYEVMLPLMAASVVAYFVARSVQGGSMYEITVQRRQAHDARMRLRGLEMRDLVEPAHTVVPPDADLAAMSRLFLQYPVKYLYVTDAAQHFLGVVPLTALSAAVEAEKRRQAAEGAGTELPGAEPGPLAGQCAADLVRADIAPLEADMELGAALQRFLQHRGERLPVVESAARPVLLGVVSKSALLATYVRLSDQNPMA